MEKILKFKKIFNLGFVTGLLSLLTTSFSYASMQDYCTVPPFAATEVKPNVVFLIDYSGSMHDPAYYKCNYPGQKNFLCGDIQVTFNPDITYYGYFDPKAYYSYDSNNSVWKKNEACWSLISSHPEWKGIGYGMCYSGNFLNFLLTSRMDAAFKAFIGGRGDCQGDKCKLLPEGFGRFVTVNFKNGSCKFDLKHDWNDDTLSLEVENTDNCPFYEGNYGKVAVSIDSSERHGVIQDNFDKVDMSLLIFSGPKTKYCPKRKGVVKYSFYEKDLNKLVDAIQNERPCGHTSTGEAMYEVEDFLKQEDEHSYEHNSQYIDKGTEKDPYYMEVNGNLYPVPCKKTYVILISDGYWDGDVDPEIPAYEMHTKDIREDIEGNQTADIFTVYTFDDDKRGKNAMETVATYGSFADICSDGWPYPFTDFVNSENQNWPVEQCNPEGSYNECCKEWDDNRDGYPDHFFEASNGAALEKDLRKIFQLILNPVSGTSVASLSKKNVKGAVLCQSVFYPTKNFGNNRLSWIGYLYTWWFLNTKTVQNIREDTNSNKILDVQEDFILNWAVDDEGNLAISKYSSDSKGLPLEKVGTYDSFESLKPIFEVGNKLTYLSPKDRVIYTEVNGKLVSFDTSKLDSFSSYLGDELPACLGGDKGLLVDFIRGKDVTGCRSRTIDDEGDTWKLGDITYSSPVVVKYKDYSVIFVGSNDGMLHAFRLGHLRRNTDSQHPVALDNSATDTNKDMLGEELWAFIPKNALPYLRYLADPNYCHLYFIDMTPYVVDVDSDGDGIPDKKILIGGMRLGGATGSNDSAAVQPPSDTCPDPSSASCVGLSSYFALDVTDPENPVFLWEFSSPDLGFSYSGPGIVKEDGKYYVVFASGPVNYKGEYSGSSDTLKIFILDLMSGELKRKIDTGISNAFAGRLFKEGADLNGDGNTDYLIFGYSKQQQDSFGGGLIVLAGKGSNSVILYPLKGTPDNWEAVDIGAISSDEMCNKLSSRGDLYFKEGLNRLCSNISISFTSLPPVTSKVEVMRCFDKWYLYFGTGKWFYRTDDSESVPEICMKFMNYVEGCTPAGIYRNFLFGIPLLPNTGDYSNFDYIVLSPPIPAESTDAFNLIPVVGSPVSDFVEGTGLNDIMNTAICTFRTELKNLGIEFGWFIPLDEGEGEYLKEKALSDPTVTKSNVVMFTTSQPTVAPCKIGGRSRVWALNCALGWSVDSPVECDAYGVTNLYGTLLLQLSGSNIEQLKLTYIASENKSNIRQKLSEENYRATTWLTGIAPESAPPFMYPSTALIGTLLLWLER